MYESYYGLTNKPFSMLPDPGFMYPSKKHQMALTLLEYGLFNQAGFSVISGETGAGKTTLLRKLLSNIEQDVTVGMISNTHKSFGELLDWVLSAFGIHEAGLTKVQMHQKFIDFLMEQYASNKSALLIVDEAQNLKAETLEELRMLSNVNSEKDQLLQVILAGQPELKETLHKPELMQFAQRISVDFHLEALDLKETCGYIQHRLVTAGAERDVFTPEACKSIYEYSDGIPRLINLLCDTVMVYGFADQCELIDAKLVEEMVRERMKDSVVPILKNLTKNKTKNSKNSGETIDLQDFPWISPPEEFRNAKRASKARTEEESGSDTDADSKPASAQDKDNTRKATGRKKTISADSDRNTVAAQSAQSYSNTSNGGGRTYRELAGTNHKNIIEVMSPDRDMSNSFRWMKVSTIAAVVLAFAAVVFAVTGNMSGGGGDSGGSTDGAMSEEIKKQMAEVEQMKLEQERRQKLEAERVKLLEQKTEQLQRERDEALARAEAEKERLAKERAEAEAARKAAAEEAARRAAAKERQALREAQAAAKAAAERERLAVEAARRAEQEAAEARKQARMALELERLKKAEEQRRRAQQTIDENDLALKPGAGFDDEAAADTGETRSARTREQQTTRQSDTEKFSVDPCSRPTAKFLSTCR